MIGVVPNIVDARSDNTVYVRCPSEPSLHMCACLPAIKALRSYSKALSSSSGSMLSAAEFRPAVGDYPHFLYSPSDVW